MDEQQIKSLVQVVSKCENYLVTIENPYMTSETKAGVLQSGLKEIRDQIKRIYLEAGGENVWMEKTNA